MKRKLAMILTGCMLLSGLVGCSGASQSVSGENAKASNSEPTKLVIAARGGSHVDVIEAVKEKFEQENNVKIEVLGLESADLKQKVSLDAVNKEGAYDLTMIDDPWMPEFCEANLLADLTKMGYKEDNDFVKKSLDIGRNPYATGDVYALPFAGNVQFLFYNKNLLESNKFSVPQTWEDVLNISKAINGKDDKTGYVIRGQQGNPIVSDYLPILWAYGGNVFNNEKDWKVTVDSKEGKEALKMYIDLLKNGKNYEKNDIVAAVSSGKGAMSLGWPSWYISGESATAEYAAIPRKVNASSASNNTGMIGNWMMGITANSKNKDMALKFLEYVTSTEVQIKATEKGGVPTRTSVLKDNNLALKYPYFKTLLEGTENSVIRPRTPHWSDIETAYGTELSNAISGTKTVDQALADAKVAIEAIMK